MILPPMTGLNSRHFLRLEAALTLPEVWRALSQLVPGEIACRSLSLGLEISESGPVKIFWHGDRRIGTTFAAPDELLGCPGQAVLRLPAKSPGKFMAVLAWRERKLQAALVMGRDEGGSGFSAADMKKAAAIQAHFAVCLRRVLDHQERVLRAEQLSAMLEYVPIGLLLLDWDVKPLWHNNEAANCCAFWNHGERRALAVNARRTFRVPPAIRLACVDLRTAWEQGAAAKREPHHKLHIVVNESPALHAQIAVHRAKGNPLARPVFRIHLDYRRPRGDREKQISENAIALLDRLSGREREVAMWMREGLRNAEIAAEMRVSPATIKSQLASIYAKLDVPGRTRAAALLNR
jgi:DNA-binding CsgD family transcriptional regulator